MADADAASDSALVRELADKQAIVEIMYLYARGWDRKDEATIRACFHPGATLRYGAFDGTADDFTTASIDLVADVRSMSHLITNPIVVVKHDRAICETGFLAHHRRPAPDGGEEDMFLKGRYLSRFARRDGSWKIDRYEAYLDFERIMPPADRTLAGAPAEHRGRFKPDDPLYALLDTF